MVEMYSFFTDLSTPKLPDLPSQILVQGEREQKEIKRYLEIAKLVGCDLPTVEFSFGGYKEHNVPNPVRECEDCIGGKSCPAWSLSISRSFARSGFEGDLQRLRGDKLSSLKDHYEDVLAGSKSAKQFLKTYRKVWAEGQGLLGIQILGPKGTPNKPFHSTPEEIERIVETLTNAARNAKMLLDGIPDRRGGSNLAAAFCANRVGVLFKVAKLPITHGSSSIDKSPSTKFSRAVRRALELFQPEIGGDTSQVVSVNWDAQSRRVARLMAT